MLHGFTDAVLRRVLQSGLVNCIADHEHIINTDTDQQEGHQVVNTGSLAAHQEHETEA